MFDIKVVETEAESYYNRMPREVLQTAKKEKKAKYAAASEERQAFFTPVSYSVDGVLGMERETFLKRIGENSAMNYSTCMIMGWIRTWLLFAVLWSPIFCLRKSHTTWSSIERGLEDGAPLHLTMK